MALEQIHSSDPQAAIRSFDGYLEHSHMPIHEIKALHRSFKQVANGQRGYDAFVASIASPAKKANRIATEAWIALRFPTVGTFFKHVNKNPHLSPDRRKAISRVVRESLFFTKANPGTPLTGVCKHIGDSLHQKAFHKGWDGNIRWVIGEISGTLDLKPGERAGDKRNLIAVFRDTLKAIHSGYRAPSGRAVYIDRGSVDAMQRGTQLFQSCPALMPGLRGAHATTITVVNKDSLNAAHDLIVQGKYPLVLNLANAQSPGGGVRGGSKAQEEDLFRCTNYDDALNPAMNPALARQLSRGKYRIPETGAILTPRVTVLRDGSKNYEFLERPFEVAMLASAAYNQKPGHWGGAKGTTGPAKKASKAHFDLVPGTKEKLRTQLAVAANAGYRDLVLGAFGCGAFLNDPVVVSGLYRELLEGEFRGVFDSVTFAVWDTSGNLAGNFGTFSRTFGGVGAPHAVPAPAPAAAASESDQGAPASVKRAHGGDGEAELDRLVTDIAEHQQALQILHDAGEHGQVALEIQEQIDTKQALLESLLSDEGRDPSPKRRR